MSEHVPPEGIDLEQLLADALRPIEPPEQLGGRVETTLAKLTEAAASELSWWADELSDTELQALRDPRNWVRPVAAAAVGGVAGTALVLIEVRRRRRGEGIALDRRRSAPRHQPLAGYPGSRLSLQLGLGGPGALAFGFRFGFAPRLPALPFPSLRPR